MQNFALEAIEGIVGFGLPAMGTVMLVLAIRAMAMHTVLLHGTATHTKEQIGSGGCAHPLAYNFYLQNLEEVAFPGVIEIFLQGRGLESEVDQNSPHPLLVEVYAGPKQVKLIGAGRNEQGVYWHAEFPALPAYDTWKLCCFSYCEKMDLTIRRRTEERHSLLLPRLAIEMKPSALSLDIRGKRREYAGIAATPPYSVFFFVLSTAILAYVSLTTVFKPTLLGISESWQTWQLYDWIAVTAMVTAVWLGFVLIRRPVYPIIQGYLSTTKVWVQPVERSE